MINAKDKMGLKFNAIIQNLDIHCLKSHHFSYTIFPKVWIQGTKKSCTKKSRAKKTKQANSKILTLFRTNKLANSNC